MALEHEIAQLGRRMGIAGLALSPQGMLAFDVEGMGRLYLECKADALLIYLSRPAPSYDTTLPRRVLALCHYSNAHPVLLDGGIHNGQVILLTRMAERGVTAAALENTVDYLAQQMNRVFRN